MISRQILKDREWLILFIVFGFFTGIIQNMNATDGISMAILGLLGGLLLGGILTSKKEEINTLSLVIIFLSTGLMLYVFIYPALETIFEGFSFVTPS